MPNLSKIVYEALISTSKNTSWWILAFVQALSLFLIGSFAKPRVFGNNKSLILFFSIIILQPVTVWLWLQIKACYQKEQIEIKLPRFLYFSGLNLVISFFAVLIATVARLGSFSWIFLSIISSLVAATSLLVMLYCTLCEAGIIKSFLLALDTWRKKISLAAGIAFALMVCHGISFAIAHAAIESVKLSGGFSDFSHSATIWILLLVLAVLIGFFNAVLNYILVALFLESIKPLKLTDYFTSEKVSAIAEVKI